MAALIAHPYVMTPSGATVDEAGGDLRLMLFVTGDAPLSHRARGNLEQTLARFAPNDFRCEEVDAFRQPDRALAYGLIAAPALVVESLSGQRHVFYGDLSDRTPLEALLGPLVAMPGC